MTPSASVAVLMYHDVVSGSVSRGFRRFVVDPALFEEHLDAVAAAGYRTGTIAELADPSPATVTTGDKRVVLTFDDAFASFAERVVPMLVARQQSGTVFVPSAFVGRTTTWLSDVGEGDRPLVGWSDLVDARRHGIEIGAHGHRHLELDVLDAAALSDELTRSRGELEDRLADTVTTMAYPFGYHNRAVRRAAAVSGYRTACEVGYGLHRSTADPLRIRRMLVGPHTTADQLVAMIEGGSTTPVEHARRLTRPAWRAYRRSRARTRGLPK